MLGLIPKKKKKKTELFPCPLPLVKDMRFSLHIWEKQQTRIGYNLTFSTSTLNLVIFGEVGKDN